MKKTILLLFTTLALINSAWAQKAPSKAPRTPNWKVEDLKPEDQDRLRRMVSFALLHEVQLKLQAVVEKQDPKALKSLLAPWSPADQTEIASELKKYSEPVEFKIKSDTLTMITKAGETVIQVEDPFTGKFKVNGVAVRVEPNLPYKSLKTKLDDSASHRRPAHPIFDALIPPAEAVNPVAACVKFCKPALAAAGGFIKKHAWPAALNAGRFVVSETWAYGKHIVYTVTFTCLLTSQSLAVPCSEIPARIMCGSNQKSTKDCVDKVSEISPEIKQADASNTKRVTLIQPKNDNKCTPTESGFSKDITILMFNTDDLKSTKDKNPDAVLPSPEATAELHLEYAKNPSDPQKLITKTITEVIKSKSGQIEAKRIWTFEGDEFKVDYFDAAKLSSNSRLPEPYRRPPEVIDCRGKDNSQKPECKALNQQVLGTLGDNINCYVENPAAVIEQIKKDEKPAAPAKGTR